MALKPRYKHNRGNTHHNTPTGVRPTHTREITWDIFLKLNKDQVGHFRDLYVFLNCTGSDSFKKRANVLTYLDVRFRRKGDIYEK